MRINIGQTTNLFHVNALNQSVQRNTSEKEEQKPPIRTDIASISPMGSCQASESCESDRNKAGRTG